MRRIVHLSVGILAGLLVTSTVAQAAADISIFGFAPSTSSGTDGRPLAAAIPRETVNYSGPYSPGSILVNTTERRLYFVLPDHQAIKYGVGVGRPGFTWAGASRIANKREWPDWTPPAQMIK